MSNQLNTTPNADRNRLAQLARVHAACEHARQLISEAGILERAFVVEVTEMTPELYDPKAMLAVELAVLAPLGVDACIGFLGRLSGRIVARAIEVGSERVVVGGVVPVGAEAGRALDKGTVVTHQAFREVTRRMAEVKKQASWARFASAETKSQEMAAAA